MSFLSKFLPSRTKPNPASRVEAKKSKKGESPYNSIHSRKKSDVDGKGAEDIVMNEAERQLYRHGIAEGEQDFGDMIKLHQNGQSFPYASIIARPEENYDARVRRLQNMQPHVLSKKIDLPDYVNVKLTKTVEDFPFTEVFKVPSKGIKMTGYDYVCIKRVTLIFAPLSSFVDTHSDVIVSLLDMRKRTNNITRALKLQDNKNYRGEFALDYSFPKSSIDKVSLSFAQEVPTFMVGEQWGACQMFFELEEATFPLTYAFQETIGTLGATESMLQEYQYNPAVKDLAIRDTHLKSLRDMYLNGEILDETEAKHDRKAKVSYASSSGIALSKLKARPRRVETGFDGEVDWSAVQNQPISKVPQDQVSKNSFAEEDEEEAIDAAEHRKLTLEKYKKEQEAMNEIMQRAKEKESEKNEGKETGDRIESVPKAKKSTRFAESPAPSSKASSGEIPIDVGKFANLRIENFD